MRELTVTIRFTDHSLGNVRSKTPNQESFLLPTTPDGRVLFLSTWHQSNMRFAAKLFGRHLNDVDKICWDVGVDTKLVHNRWYKRHYTANNGKLRFAVHESLVPGQLVSINCTVPSSINDGDFIHLMNLAGRYIGLSAFKPKDYGHFTVVGIKPQQDQVEQSEIVADSSVTGQEVVHAIVQ